MNKGRELLANLKLYSDYLKWDEDKGRYETWNEACEDVLYNTHIKKYGEKIKPYLDEVLPYYQSQVVLASQRNLQYRGDQILKHNSRQFNCLGTYCYTPDVFEKSFYQLLCGCGLGVSLRNKFIKQLPKIHKRSGELAKTFTIPDSIEGWAKSVHVLLSSYCKHPSLSEEYFGYNIKFDYSQIRSKGSYISGGFKAPGHEGLKQSLERIEGLLEKELGNKESIDFRSIIAYDIFMHISDAVLSGGVRRSAMLCLMDYDDKELMYAKTGNWRQTHPWRARSNNSVGLIRNKFTKEEFNKILELNKGDNDIGFIFCNNEDEVMNPCSEIMFNFYKQIEDYNYSAFQGCNLNSIIAPNLVDKNGGFDENLFYEACRKSAILGTLQAGYTDFPNINKQTEKIFEGEALLGVSINGWMQRPELFNEEILNKGAEIVKETNKEVADFIGINYAARTTCVKPAGNETVITGIECSGITPSHSLRGFRVMQQNKNSEIGRYLYENMDFLIEESVWSSTNSDYVVFAPYKGNPEGIYKSDMKGVKHLEYIKMVQNSWVSSGKREGYSYLKDTMHNVSNTVIIDDYNEITDYLFENQNHFTAVSFVSEFSDKDYNQSPFTSVLNSPELLEKYGEGVIFASGLIVDGLHYYGDLWEATNVFKNKDMERNLEGSRDQVLLKKDWLRRARKFAKNYFGGNIDKMIYCLKDVHLYHKYNTIDRKLKEIPDFSEVLTQPEYNDIDQMGAIACSGGQCEI